MHLPWRGKIARHRDRPSHPPLPAFLSLPPPPSFVHNNPTFAVRRWPVNKRIDADIFEALYHFCVVLSRTRRGARIEKPIKGDKN